MKSLQDLETYDEATLLLTQRLEDKELLPIMMYCTLHIVKIEQILKNFFLIPRSIGQHQEKIFVALSWSVK